MNLENLSAAAIQLLKDLIEIPSFSSEEQHTAKRIEAWFNINKIPFNRNQNNIWAVNKYFDASKPTLLLNSHHDTRVLKYTQRIQNKLMSMRKVRLWRHH